MDQSQVTEKPDESETDRIIGEELEKLLESPMFVRSPVLTRLLQRTLSARRRRRIAHSSRRNHYNKRYEQRHKLCSIADWSHIREQ